MGLTFAGAAMAMGIAATKAIITRPRVLVTVTLTDNDRQPLTALDFTVIPAGGAEEILLRAKEIAKNHPSATEATLHVAGVFVCRVALEVMA